MDQRKLILHQVASTEQGRVKTLPSSVGCDKVSLTELLPPSADLTELGRETKDYRVGEMTVCHALSIYGAEHFEIFQTNRAKSMLLSLHSQLSKSRSDFKEHYSIL